jgi:hypothetical protein
VGGWGFMGCGFVGCGRFIRVYSLKNVNVRRRQRISVCTIGLTP